MLNLKQPLLTLFNSTEESFSCFFTSNKNLLFVKMVTMTMTTTAKTALTTATVTMMTTSTTTMATLVIRKQ